MAQKKPQEVFLGIDAGGTKTTAAVATKDGKICGLGQGGGANYHNVGLVETESSLQQAIAVALDQAERKLGHPLVVRSACLGIAGLDTERDRRTLEELVTEGMLKILLGEKAFLVNDSLIGLRSGIDENYGLCLIAGTGSCCYGLNRKGQDTHAGDWGFLLGDQGGGYAIGRKILQTVVASYDGRYGKTLLTDLLLAKLKLAQVSDLVFWAYGGKVEVGEIASLAPLVHQAAQKGDKQAKEIIKQTGDELVLAVQGTVGRLGMEKEEFPIVFIGGLFGENKQLLSQTQEGIKQLFPKTSFIIPSKEPVEGAVALAIERKG